MSRINRLNKFLTHMLLINNLWLDNFKALNVKNIPMGKVPYSGGKIKFLMDKTLHHGDKNLTNRDGLLQLDLLINLQCLSILNCDSWLY